VKYSVTVKRYISTTSTYRVNANSNEEAEKKALAYAREDADFDQETMKVVNVVKWEGE
jgi:hypothetical protein